MGDEAGQTLGNLLRHGREEARISGREAARRAGITEGRWRQVVAGDTAPAKTIAAMALAIGLDPKQALAAAGMSMSDESIAKLAAEVQQRAETRAAETLTGAALSRAGLADEIERIKSLPLPPEEKIRVAKALIDLYAERPRQPAE